MGLLLVMGLGLRALGLAAEWPGLGWLAVPLGQPLGSPRLG